VPDGFRTADETSHYKGDTMKITTKDLEAQLARYVRACERLGLIPEGMRVGLDHGSKTYGRAFRVYLTGIRAEDGTYPNGSGHGRPPAGDDFLGMTKREAFTVLADRARTLEDVARTTGKA
jgi:hypothetical protein